MIPALPCQKPDPDLYTGPKLEEPALHRHLFPFALGLVFAFTAAAQGVVTTVSGTGWVFPVAAAATAAPLGASYGVAVDRDGALYSGVCDNHFLFKRDPSERFSIVDGNGLPGFFPDRLASGSRMARPILPLFTPEGGRAFAENSRIRKLSAEGHIVTIAGGGHLTGENILAAQARSSTRPAMLVPYSVGPFRDSLASTRWTLSSPQMRPPATLKTTGGQDINPVIPAIR